MPGQRVVALGVLKGASMLLMEEKDVNAKFTDLKSRTNNEHLKKTIDTTNEVIIWRLRLRIARKALKGELWKQGK